MNAAFWAISVLRRLSIIGAIGITFLFGLATTVYLSLRSPEVRVPEVVGKGRFEAERVLGEAGLNFRVRATRPSNQAQPNTVLFQLPRAGEVVKVGQTVAMDISRAAKEGEASEGVVTDKKVAEEQSAENVNANTNEVNENKPRRNKNKNANENENDNDNTDVHSRNDNSAGNVNARNANASQNANRDKAVDGGAVNPVGNTNQNQESREPVSKPSPASRNTNTPNP